VLLQVMYTMYQGISASLPKTAYLKFIDAWVFFCLLIPFVVFLIEVYWELMRTNRQKKMEKEKKKLKINGGDHTMAWPL
jgi:large-conductance mechanosensitive channel